jgi:hypothetical protein
MSESQQKAVVEALRAFIEGCGQCTCHEAFSGRKLTDPSCIFCGFKPEIAMGRKALEETP